MYSSDIAIVCAQGSFTIEGSFGTLHIALVFTDIAL